MTDQPPTGSRSEHSVTSEPTPSSAPFPSRFAARRLAPATALFVAALVVATNAPSAERAAESSDDDIEFDLYARIGGAAARDVHRPASVTFAGATRELERRVGALCRVPTPTTLASARDAFTGTVATFSRMELLRVGPLMEDNRLNRLFYWPDTRRAGERQLRALLLTDDVATVTDDSMPSRSVAVQGLPALERLLHADAADVLAEPATDGRDAPGSARCAVAHAVAGNVAKVAGEIERAWASEDGIVRRMSVPRAGDPLFRTSNEIIRSLLTQLETGVDVMVERKLGPALAEDPPSRRAMPFRRSGLTAENLAGNVESLRALAIDSGLARRAGLDEEMGFELRVAAGHAKRLVALQPEAPLPNAIGAEEADVMRALLSTMTSIGNTVLERLSPTLGVRTGFNAQDGD